MSARFYTLCTVGLVGSLFVGYCVYFDRKRRSDPDYKKKVLARRKTAKKSGAVDLRDPKVREEFLMSEMMKGNQKLTEGNIEEAIGHFINFVHFSGNPRTTLSTLQQTMPAPLFSLLVRAYATLQSEGALAAGGGDAKKDDQADVD
ncbi:mitochondrial import receptor subunit TOM20 homolog B-like [Halichondria panicea]|uniref:mitochondrial import receptor subunit TOM20 homolog B-like n=1 Tax=Halichondria panicea TaxID=6063 RepID=UPI00312B3851